MRGCGVARSCVPAREALVSARPSRQRALEFVTEFRRLMDGLAKGAVIVEDCNGDFSLENAGRVVARSVSRGLVEASLAADLLDRVDQGMVLSHVGLARIRRSDAGHDDRFRAQHQSRTREIREIDGIRQSLIVNDGESPLGWLRRRKDRFGRPLISDEQFEAGERLRADYWFAQMSPSVTADWSTEAPANRSRRGAPAGAAVLRDEVLAAKDRVMSALVTVGPEISGVLVDICCELKGLEEAEKENGWPQRSGKVVLQIALTRLARHYGLIKGGNGGARKLSHWGRADYRPSIDGVAGESDRH